MVVLLFGPMNICLVCWIDESSKRRFKVLCTKYIKKKKCYTCQYIIILLVFLYIYCVCYGHQIRIFY